MNKTFPVSNKKFEEHVNDTTKHIGFPDYSSYVDYSSHDTKSTPLEIPYDGWLYLRAQITQAFYINGCEILAASDASQDSSFVPVSAGDVLSSDKRSSKNIFLFKIK